MTDPTVSSGSVEFSRRTLVQHFHEQVRVRGDSAALYHRVADRFEAISWSSFADIARCLSAFLIEQGVAEQEHVAIWSNNRPEWHIADIAVLSVRARPVPIYLTLSSEQGGYVLGHSESRVIFVEDAAILGRVLEVRSSLPSLVRIVMMSGQLADTVNGLVVTWADAVAAGKATLGAQTAAEVDRRAKSVDFQDVATLIYTSGTTGPPKAVTLTHANIAAVANALMEFVAVGPDQRVLSYLPLAHIAERLVSEFRSYMYGNPTYFLDGIPNLGARLKEVRPTQFFAVPRVWEKMAQTVKNQISEASGARRRLALWALKIGERAHHARANGRVPGMLARQHRLADKIVLHKLRAALGLDEALIMACGAAPISPDILTFFASMGLEICEVYGQTEDTGVATINRPGKARIGTVGTAITGVEIKIAADGELLVRGDGVFAGYYKDPEATAETLIDGWLHTGDVGEFDADGYLRITDRKKDLIITAGGKNIAPSNIENALKLCPLIANAVAIGDRRAFVTALVTLDVEEAQRFARQHSITGWTTPADLGDRAEVQEAIAAHVAAVNADLSHVEQVKKWVVLTQDFAIGDELTPTLKVKRKVVAEKYVSQIEGMYSK